MATKGKRLTLLVACAGVVLGSIMVAVYRDDIAAWYWLTRDFERLPDNEQGYPEYRHRKTGIVFVGLRGGTCLMGTAVDIGDAPERLETEVTLHEFLIAKHEVVPILDAQGFCKKNGLQLPTDEQLRYAPGNGQVGTIIEAVDLKAVVLNAGRDQDAKAGNEFVIYRGGKFVGKVKVVQLYRDVAGAEVLFENEGERIQVGDRATMRLGDARFRPVYTLR